MLKIPQQILDRMVEEAHAANPHECCGLLAGHDGLVTHVYPIKNIVALEESATVAHFDAAKVTHLRRLTPAERAEIAFVMDAREQSLAFRDMRRKGIHLQAFYHSHPKDPARPSVTDIKNAVEFDQIREKLNLPAPCHLIISLMDPAKADVRAYWISAGDVVPADITIV
ncbi:MAG: M67 family metallopeptidase [Nitrospirales bacterium]